MKRGFKYMVLGTIVISMLSFSACRAEETPSSAAGVGSVLQTTEPTQIETGESFVLYTWGEYQNLTVEQQIAYQNSFSSPEAFDTWLQDAQPVEIEAPWDNGGKQPDEYTWEEFEALTAEQQILFQNCFESFDDFDAWMEQAQFVKLETPWENGGKQPEDYTWEEFELLTPEQQIQFQNSFESLDAFDEWLEHALTAETVHSTESVDTSVTYCTWEEFENMTAEEQMAYQNSFESMEAFDEWLQRAQNIQLELPWENGGKAPEDYTWEEFENLSPELQIAFQNAFSNMEAFDAWLVDNMP